MSKKMSLSLAEEYLQRHNIEDVNYIKHIRSGTIFMREESNLGIEWGLTTINFFDRRTDDTHGPGNYVIRHMRPIHDGYQNRKGMFETIASTTLEWDQYEDYMWSLILRPGRPRVMKDQKEVLLTAWEMFLYCCDSGLISYANNEIMYRTIDPEIPSSQRYSGFSTMKDQLQKTEPNFYDLWNKEFMQQHVKNNCQWLAKLMDEKGVV
jgi:hypothetical protein